MKITGLILLLLGFIGASVASVWRIEVVEDKWSTIPWFHYGIAMVIGIVGVVLLRAAARVAAEDTTQVDADYATLTKSLTTLVTRLAELRGVAAKQHPREIVKFIDSHLALPFAEFADARNVITRRHGLTAFAEIMTQFASGERFVNRAWSAAADGYVDEARSSLETADRYLNEAQRVLGRLGDSGK